MKMSTRLHKLFFAVIMLFSLQGFSQCFQIESILVDACSAASPTTDEGFNEMVRFRIGPNPVNTSTLTVNWPSNGWTGVIQNATTASKVLAINNAIIAAGNCGQVIQPVGGVIPANAEVLLITSYNFTVNFNSFNALNSTLYIIFQNNPTQTNGHFANYNATPGTRTLTMSFGGGCTDSVTYERSDLTNINGGHGGPAADQDGATVNFTPAGVPSYTNTGCNAPVPPFTVTASANPTVCVLPGSVVTLTGTAQGQQSVAWTSSNGTVTNPTNLNATYTVPTTATGTITFTLTATNSCGATINATTSITIGVATAPAVSPVTYCQNATATPLTATPSTGGTLNWYGTSATGGTASATAPTPSTTGASGTVTHYYVSQTIGGCESPRADIVVTIGGNAPTATPFLFCDAAATTATSVGFDFNNVGQTNFTYSYSINGGTPVTGTFASPSHFDVPVTGPGTQVDFTITWNGVCTPSRTVTCYSTCAVTPVLSIHNPPAACSPNTVDITAPAVTAGSTGGGTLTYWTNAAATTPLSNPSAVAVSGTYYIKSALGSCSDIDPVVVTINPSPSLTITNPAAVCAPNTVDITAPAVTAGSTGGGTLSYWTNSAGTTALSNPNAVAVSGTYYIKSTAGACSDIDPVVVTINTTPVLTITNPVAACSPNTVDITLPAVTAGSTGGGTLSYWTNAAGTTALSNPTAIAVSGTYYIKSTLGSCSDIDPVVVTITVTPVVSTHNPAAVCSPNTVDLTLPAVTAGSTGGGTLSYWTNPAGTTTLTNPNAVAVGGTYYIKSTVGTCSDIEPVTVTINTTPVLNITNPAAVCSPNTVNITLPAVTAGSTGGGTLSYWTNAAGTTALSNPTAIAVSGTYYIKSTLGSCSDIDPVIVTINPTPSLVITNPAGVCLPNTVDITVPAITAGSTGGGTLTYWINSAATNALSDPTAITSSGTYYIKSTVGTCSDIEPVVVTINPTPALLITNPAAVCSPNTVDITAPVITAGSSGAGTLTYWMNATATTPLTNPNAVSVSGTYYIKSTVGSCFDIEPVTVTISSPNLVITNPLSVCLPNTVDITAPAITAGSTGIGVLSYWTDPAATLPLASPNAIAVSGTYYIKSTSGSCTDIEPVVVNINANFSITIPQPLEECDPNRDGFDQFDLTQLINTITGGNPIYTVTFHETSTDADIAGTSIPVPAAYENILPYLQTIYIRVSSSTSTCYQIIPFNLIVHDNPLATTPTPYPLCDNTGLANEETFDLTTKIPEILGSLSPANYTVTFYTDRGDAEFPRNRITSIAAYTSPTDTLYVRVEDNTTHCFDIVELELIVNPLPNSLQPNYPQYSLCDNTQSPASEIGYELFDLDSKVSDVLLGQTGMIVTFYPSLSAAQNNLSPITVSPYRNIIQYVQTLGIRITNSQTGCYVISTMDIRVEPLPTLIPPSRPYTLCDDDQDGYTTFDLTTLLSGMLNGITTYTVSFHETYDDALLNGTTIPNPAAYDNVNPYGQTIFVRAEDNLTHCVSIISIQLVVNPGPVAPINLADIVVCDTDTNSQDGITRVDLTQRNADALAVQQGAASDYIVEYYLSQTAADIGTSPIIPATSYPATNGQTIWVRVEHITTGCYNTGTFDIVINSPLLLITPTPLSLCDDDANPNNQFHSFDLTVKNNEITQNLPYTVTYYPTYAMAQAQVAGTEIATPTAYTNVSPAVQTLGVVVTTGAGCKSITTLDIRVLPIPTPRTNPPALAPKCDDNNPGDMVEVFDLTVNEAYIRNNDPSLSFSYYYNQADALVPRNPIPVPTAATVGGNVWIRVENTRVDYLGNHCFVLVEQALTVNPLPAVNPSPAPYRVCDDNADGIADFDMTLPALATSILNTATTGQQPADFTISYYLTAAGANPATNTGETPLPNTYTNTASPNSQVVYIRVVNNATGCVNPAGTLTLAVEAYATATGPQTFADCDNYNDPYDGVHRIDLTQYETAILNGQNPAVFLVSYYTSLTDAQAGTGALTLAEAQAYETDPDTDTIWVKVENSSNLITPYCYAITTIDITVERYPNPIINTPNGVTTICVDFVTGVVVRPLTLDSGITNPANYTFEWFENGSTTPIAGATGSTYTVSTADAAGATRSYTVHVTSTSALGCDTTSASFDVIQSGQASIPTGTVGYTVTNAFTASQIITVTVEGYGTYEYSLDDGPRQTSNVFENVSLGSHVIHVWDTEGGIAYSCEELIINDVMVIDYPHYFTPNGDGIHDTWNIVGLANQPAAKIYIFDRYGKLLKQISSAGAGWDGTYNGHLLPADDYWFTVDFMEQSVMKQFKAHFTLKR